MTLLFLFLLGLVLAGVIFIKLSPYLSKFKVILFSFSILAFILPFVIYFLYYTHIIIYNYTDSVTAKRGLIFKDTAMLDQYRLVGQKDYVFFKIDEYTRSDRQNEVIEVRVNSLKNKE